MTLEEQIQKLTAERDGLIALIDKANSVGYGNAVTIQIERIQSERDAALREVEVANKRLKVCAEDRDSAAEARDAALKACAQKDDALNDCSQFPLGESLHYKVCSALDDNTCGKGYYPKREIEPLIHAIRVAQGECAHNIGLRGYPSSESPGWKACQKALAHAERLTGKETK